MQRTTLRIVLINVCRAGTTLSVVLGFIHIMKKSILIVASAMAIEVVDVVLKLVAINSFQPDTEVISWPVALALHKNPGITGDTMIPLVIVIPITLLVIIVLAKWAWEKRKERVMAAAGAGVVVIGALGNLVDRVMHGFTTDYLIFFRLSAINLSDILIVTGAIILLCCNRSTPQSTK